MINSEAEPLNERFHITRRFFLPSLVFSYFAIMPPLILTAYLLLNIGETFGTPEAITSQIRTAASILAAITAVFMGAWSVRFNHKLLLLLGLIFINISALGCIFALNFSMMLLAFALSGLGSAMVASMTLALIGEHLPLQKRPNAIGWVFTGGSLAFIISAPIIGLLAIVGGWRLAFLGIMLPAPLLSFLLVVKGVPSLSQSSQNTTSNETYWKGFKKIFSNRSATVCLISNALGMAAYQALELFGAAFLQINFQISLEFIFIYFSGGATFYILAYQISGRVVNRFGMKPVTIVTSVFASLCIISFMSMPNLWLFLAFVYLSCFFDGIRRTAANSLTLEQVPEYKGSIMSLNSAFFYIGIALGASVGGLILLLWEDYYAGVGLVLGIMSLLIAILFYFVVSDPTSSETTM
jgi:predicted MFS family arabinose efflux permease